MARPTQADAQGVITGLVRAAGAAGLTHNSLVEQLESAGKSDHVMFITKLATAGVIVPEVASQATGSPVLTYKLPSA